MLIPLETNPNCLAYTAAEIRERLRQFEARTSITPSARTSSAFLPYRPESSNPEKILDSRDWDLFVIDLPKINAFVLPTKEIFVYSGLIDLLEKEEPLIAAVMAHEISTFTAFQYNATLWLRLPFG